MNFKDLSFLTSVENKQIIQRVLELQDYWTSRAQGHEYYSLGATSFQDCLKGKEKYFKVADRFNPVLKSNFSWLYTKLCAKISKELRRPISLTPEGAIPGFQIWLSDPYFEKHPTPFHADLHYVRPGWKNLAKPMRDFISFTLPICIPKSGAGLDYSELNYFDLMGYSEKSFQKAVAEAKIFHLPYKAGHLYLMDGYTFHRVARFKARPGEMRITLQGHILYKRKSATVYW